jgi:hypothetical protein
VLWGDELTVRGRLGEHMSDLRLERVFFRFDYPFAPSEVVEFFRQNYGPTTRAFAALDPPQQSALRAELTALWTSHNQSHDGLRTIVDSEYLQVIGITRTVSDLYEGDAIW